VSVRAESAILGRETPVLTRSVTIVARGLTTTDEPGLVLRGQFPFSADANGPDGQSCLLRIIRIKAERTLIVTFLLSEHPCSQAPGPDGAPPAGTLRELAFRVGHEQKAQTLLGVLVTVAKTAWGNESAINITADIEAVLRLKIGGDHKSSRGMIDEAEWRPEGERLH
jgi:hypothetical protein